MEETDTVALYQRPMHPYSQALIGAYPSLKGKKEQLRSIPGAPPQADRSPDMGAGLSHDVSHAMAVCAQEEPQVKESEGHRVACHLIK